MVDNLLWRVIGYGCEDRLRNEAIFTIYRIAIVPGEKVDAPRICDEPCGRT
jgi:hypothetical protein